MKAYAVSADHTRHFIDIPVPVPGDYEALVKVVACGICNGTDTKIIKGEFKGVEDYPAVLGHEGVGRVIETGSKVRNFKPGQLVMMPYLGELPKGIYSAWGTFSEYNVVCDAVAMAEDGLVPAEFAWGQTPLPDGIDPAHAVMFITFREVLSTMRLFGFDANMSVAVFGLGPVGQSFVRFAHLSGMKPVIAIGRSDEKLADAVRHGADFTVDTRNVCIKDGVLNACPGGVDFALDAAGVSSFINDGLGIIKPSAKICVYGISPDMSTVIDWSACPYNWTLQFNQFPSKKMEGEALTQILAWVECGALNPDEFIYDRVFAFDEIDEAYELALAGKAKKKIVVKM